MEKAIKSLVLLAYLTIFIISPIISQQDVRYSIEGILLNKNKLPIDYSVISIFTSSDSIRKDQKLTDNKGHFSFFNLRPNNYYIKLKVKSSEYVIVPSVLIESHELNIGEILVENEFINLNEIEIKSNKPVLNCEADHISLIIKDSYLSKSAFQSFEILNLIPNVFATPEGILVKNSSSILYLIDGKGNKYLNEINKLRIFSFSNSEIDRIEVYSNPPARFDADGFAVINVITIKNMKLTTLYSTTNIGLFQNNSKSNNYTLNNGINLNYKIREIGLSSYVQYQTNRQVESNISTSLYKAQNTNLISSATRNAHSPYIKIDLGANYKINRNNEINVAYSFSANNDNDSTRYETNSQLKIIKNGNIDSLININTLSNFLYKTNDLNLGYWYDKGAFNSDIQFNYFRHLKNENGLSYLLSNTYFADYQSQSNYGGVINFRDSILNKIELRYGLKSNLEVSNDELNNVLNIGTFSYNESINALYAQLSGKIYTTSWNIGSRFETTNWKIIKPSPEKGNYYNLFPTLFLSKKLKKMQINLSYTKRIQRQIISELNPLNTISDRFLTSTSGDIKLLKPQLFDSYECNLDINSIYISTYINHRINPRVYYPVELDSLVIKYSPQSAKYENTIGINIKYPIKYKIININCSWSSNIISSQLLDQSKSNGYFNALNIQMNYQFRNLSFSSTISWSFPFKGAYYYINSNWATYIGINYQPKEKPWTVRLNISDLFGRIFMYKTDYPLFSSTYRNVSYSRSIQLALRYNLKLGKEFNNKTFDGVAR